MSTSPYGTWRSPVTTELIVADSVRLGDVAVDGDHVYWVEGRAQEQGRQVLVRLRADGVTEDLTPAGYSVRSRVHEYGGQAFAVHAGTVWFCNDADGRLYRHDPDHPAAEPRALTPQGPYRHGEPVLDVAHRRILCVRETARSAGEPLNELVAVPADGDGQGVRVVASGHDFYAYPRPRADGRALAYVSWDHPCMPWDGTTLWHVPLDAGGRPLAPRPVAGGDGESVLQPEWGPDGLLYLVSDRSGWWNLYRLEDGELECVHTRKSDFGKPLWQLGTRTYAFAGTRAAICAWSEEGIWRLGRLDLATRTLRALSLPFTAYEALSVSGNRLVCIAAGPEQAAAVVAVDLDDGSHRVHRHSARAGIDPAYVSRPEAISFDSDGTSVHAFFYAPANPDFEAPAGERPPLVVIGHGGPTGATAAVLDPRVQFWTSRGFAVVDVNYRGSTGFGRAYRDALKGGWGERDVADCVNAARHLACGGRVDPRRLIIRGGSAGGFTALAALVFHDVFAAAASYYGISELEALARDTHKFESRYLDSLIGPYPAAREVYRARSPIHHVERLTCPVIFFQGLEDRVVPPAQAETMVEALRAKGLPVAYLAFEGEQHGFRRAATIERTLGAELYFYGRVFGFEPADRIDPVPIDNLAPP